MQMKEVCEKFDLTPDTIRYYEKIGLIGEVPRDKNGYRVFLKKNLNEIYLSKVMRGAGIPVKKLVEYVKLVQIGEETHKDRKNILSDTRENIQEDIEEVQGRRSLLDRKIKKYDESNCTTQR